MLRKLISLIFILVFLLIPTSAALAGKPINDSQKGKPADVGHKGKPPENKSQGNQYGLYGKGSDVNSTEVTGFDEFGYNDTARIFNGTGLSWCMGKFGETETYCRAYMGEYANDRLVMKWNSEWDRGNAEDWVNSPYNAWENNQWNGKVPNGSGEVWHYKIVWVGDCTANESLVPDNGYCIWNQFAVISDHGTIDGVHSVIAHSSPNGYGAYRK